MRKAFDAATNKQFHGDLIYHLILPYVGYEGQDMKYTGSGGIDEWVGEQCTYTINIGDQAHAGSIVATLSYGKSLRFHFNQDNLNLFLDESTFQIAYQLPEASIPRDLDAARQLIELFFSKVNPTVLNGTTVDTLPNAIIYFVLYYYQIYSACVIDPCPPYPPYPPHPSQALSKK